MPSLIFTAMVIGSLTFETKKEAGQITVVPVVTLPVECQCEVSMVTHRQGASGTSESRQKSVQVIYAGKSQALATLILTPSPGDDVEVTVSVANGTDINLSEVWSLNPQKT